MKRRGRTGTLQTATAKNGAVDGANGLRMVIGRNSVLALLRRRSGKIAELLLNSDEHERIQEISSIARDQEIPLRFYQRGELSKRCGSDSHQGVVALVAGELVGTRQDLIQALIEKDSYLIVALDGVQDPHNVGAILRACECFSVDGLVWSKNRCPGITPAVTKVAVGASELVPLFEVANLADTLLALQKDCYANVVCADGSAEAVTLKLFVNEDRIVVVFGSEGTGVSDLVLRRAQQVVRIPMLGEIDSLNVSQAAAVFLYELRRGRG